MKPQDQAWKDAVQALAVSIEARFTSPTQNPDKRAALAKLAIVDSLCERLSAREIDDATPGAA